MSDGNVSWAALFRESVIFQGLLALMVVGGTFALLLWGHFIPDYIWVLDATVVGYFFGAKNLMTARNGAQDMSRVAERLAIQNAEIIKFISAAPGTPMGAALKEVMRAQDEKETGWTG